MRCSVHLIGSEADLAVAAAALPDMGGAHIAEMEFGELLCDVVFSADHPPLDCGYEICSKQAHVHADGAYELEARCVVHDEQLVVDNAKLARLVAWGEADWAPVDLSEALGELLLYSNSRPAPVDLGFEFVASPQDRVAMRVGRSLAIEQGVR